MWRCISVACCGLSVELVGGEIVYHDENKWQGFSFSEDRKEISRMFSASLKGGAITGVILFVLTLLTVIPIGFLSICVGLATLLLWIGAGQLAVRYGAIRSFGDGLLAGSVAAVVAQAIGGIGSMIASAISALVMRGRPAGLGIPPQALQQLGQAGINPQFLASLGLLGGLTRVLACCFVGFIVAAVVGAISGAIATAFQPSAPSAQ